VRQFLVVTHAVGESMAVNVAFALFVHRQIEVPVVPADRRARPFRPASFSGAC